jgi:hypothetical protein
METSDLENRKEQVEKFRDQVASVVDTAEAAGIGKIQGLKETMEEVVEKITDKTGQGAHEVGGKVVEGAKRIAESGEKASHAAKDAVSSSTTSTKQAASSGLHSTAEAARAALHKASEAGAQAQQAAGDGLEAVMSAPEQLKQGSVDRAQSVMDTVEVAVGAVREDVKQGVEKAKRVGQGLREKLESVTAHIRESRTWPEPEAISTLAEGVWAPKEHNPLPTPDKSLDQSPDHACSDSEHTESSIDEKLGLQRGHDSSSDGRLKSRFLGSRLGRSVNSLVEQGVGAGKRAWGRIFTGSAETGGLHGLELKLVHLAAVGVHLAVAVWALGFDPSWLPGGKTTDESTGWLRKSALVELVCSILSLTTFLALFPWPRSGPAERNEVQVLIGTAVESLRQLLWNKGSSQGDASVSVSKSSTGDVTPPNGSQSPKKRSRKHRKSSAGAWDDPASGSTKPAPDSAKPASEDTESAPNSMKPWVQKYRLATLFSLMTRLSIVVALCYHLFFLSTRLVRH